MPDSTKEMCILGSGSREAQRDDSLQPLIIVYSATTNVSADRTKVTRLYVKCGYQRGLAQFLSKPEPRRVGDCGFLSL